MIYPGEGALQPRQENEHAHHDETFAHHASIATQHHDNTPLLPASKPRSLGSMHVWIFKGRKLPKCTWERAFWDFQAPTLPTCVLPAVPPLQTRSLGRTHFGTSSAQNSTMSTPSCRPPPPIKDQIDRLGVRILGLSRAQISKMCILLAFKLLSVCPAAKCCLSTSTD